MNDQPRRPQSAPTDRNCAGEPFVLRDDGRCFACGEQNPIGLKLRFRWDGEDYVTDFTVRPEHAGWAGIVHGGLLTTVLDEVMARLIWEKGHPAITAKLEVRFHSPLRIGEAVTVAGRITRTAGAGVQTRAEARRSDGSLVAEASAISIPP